MKQPEALWAAKLAVMKTVKELNGNISDAHMRKIAQDAADEISEYAWLIEDTKSLAWLYVQEWSNFGWTHDPIEAIRFCRREDAEQVIKMIEDDDVKATEHEWVPVNRATGSAP